MLRYQLPIIFIVMNNNGIYAGLDDDTFKEIGSEGAGDTMLRLLLLLDMQYDYTWLHWYQTDRYTHQRII